LVMMFILRE